MITSALLVLPSVSGLAAGGGQAHHNELQHRASSQQSGPFCIGVAGATASGKSSVVHEVVRLLNAAGRVASVTQDCFYKDLSPEERDEAYNSNYNFDHPNAFDCASWSALPASASADAHNPTCGLQGRSNSM